MWEGPTFSVILMVKTVLSSVKKETVFSECVTSVVM